MKILKIKYKLNKKFKFKILKIKFNTTHVIDMIFYIKIL